MKDRTEPSIRVSSPTAATKVPATELVESDPENGPRPVDDAAMDAWRASLEPPESRPHQPEQVVQQPSLTSGKVMDFQTAIKTCFNKYTIFNGRASRSEYWFFILGTSVVGLATKIIDDALFVPSEKILKPIWGLIIMLPTLAVTVRRLHDMGRSGWLLWYYNIILVIFIVIFVELLASIRDKDVFDRATDFGGIGFIVALGFVSYFLSLPGTPGPNQYGDDPLVSASQDAAQVNYRASKTHEQNRTTTDNLALLERFYDLRQTGILTDAEFEQQKERILGG